MSRLTAPIFSSSCFEADRPLSCVDAAGLRLLARLWYFFGTENNISTVGCASASAYHT